MKLHTVAKEFLPPALLLMLLWVSLSIISGPLAAIRMTVGLVSLLVVPGLSLSFALWPQKKWSLVERLVLAISLSIAVVPTTVLIMNKYGFLITAQTTIIAIIAYTALGIIVAVLRNTLRRRT